MMTKQISSALVIAAVMLAAAAVIKYAQAIELIGAEGASRAIQVVIGLVLAFFGNYMPKDVARSRASGCAESRFQSPLRVGGWLFTLAGLAYAALGAFAPIAIAGTAAIAVVATATLVTAGYCGWVALSCR
jgi:hypothetical protein